MHYIQHTVLKNHVFLARIGSGTIFFSNCNMNCIFCQNYEISQLGKGKEVTIEDLADIMLKQQEKGVENINLVTPTSYALHIIEAIKQAKSKGLVIPILIFENEDEKTSFEEFFLRFDESVAVDIKNRIQENGIMKHIVQKEESEGKLEIRVTDIAFSYAVYQRWVKENLE